MIVNFLTLSFVNFGEILETPEKLSLAVYVSFSGAKLFSLIFGAFHLFDKKQSFPSNQNISSGLATFQKLLGKKFLGSS